MNGEKRPFPVFKFILLLAILVFVCSLILHYLINRRNVLSFLPDKYTVVVQTPPLKDIYENYLPLELIDIVFSEPSMKDLRKVIFSLRGNEILKNFFTKQLINIPITISIESKNKVLFLFDVGWLSVFTRFLPFIGYNLNIKNVSIIKEGRLVIFKILGGTEIYLSIIDNILLLSLEMDSIKKAYERFVTKENFLERKSKRLVESLGRDSRKRLKILISPLDFVNGFLPETPVVNKILQKLRFYDDAILDVAINNTNVSITADLSISSDDSLFQKIISSKFSYLNVLRLIPSGVSTLGVFNLCNMEDMVSAIQSLEIQEIRDYLKKTDDTLKTFFGKDSRELIFSWIGSEVGIYKTIKSQEPVIFLKIKDIDKFRQFENKVLKNFIIETITNLRIEGVPVNQIKIVDFLQPLLKLFNVNIPSGFYILMGNYFFISLDSDNLKEIVKNFREKNIFYEDKSMRFFFRSFPLYLCLFSYYNNLEVEKPFFFKDKNILTKILDFYSTGTVAMWQDSGLKININGLSKKKRITKFINFPKVADVDTASPFLVRLMRNSSEPYFFYFRKDGTFVIGDIELNTIYSTNFGETGEIIFDEKKRTGFYVYLKSLQKLIYFKMSGATFTLTEISNVDATFNPFFYKGELYFYSNERNKFVKVDFTSQKISETALSMDESITQKPFIWNDYWAYCSGGKVYLFKNFQLQNGWPLSMDGSVDGRPLILIDHGEIKVFFITEEGRLYGWNFEGRMLKNFPVSIDGTFVEPLMKVKIKGEEKLLAISRENTIFIISPDGKVINSKQTYRLENAGVLIFDVDGDESDEIFIYGDDNFIYAFSIELNEIEGFPIKGVARPVFFDLNNDNNVELISADPDNIYVYTFRK
ncbi:MAG: hypothetical protein ACP5QT_05665 [Brevinematia bacterium]